MTPEIQACHICEAEADWVRVRMPNPEQMTYLCHRHYQSLQERNPVLAGYYNALASISPMDIRTAASGRPGSNPGNSVD